jgi:ADP-ribosylglycohydrolase
MNENGRYDSADFLNRYISFMTTPDTHNDTYAESYHRAFFANYARGVAPENCAGKENHDTASIGGLVSLPPVVFGALKESDPTAVDRRLLEQLRLTHRSEKLERYALTLGWLLRQLFADTAPPRSTEPDHEKPGRSNDTVSNASSSRAPGRWTPIKAPLQLSFGTDKDNALQGWEESQLESLAYEAGEKVGFSVKTVVEKAKRDRLPDQHVIGNMLSSACYIDQSFPAVLYLAARYADNLEAALVANTNVGGDNCHRGAVLGAIMGAAHGYEAIPERWILGLRDAAEIESEIDSFINTYGL